MTGGRLDSQNLGTLFLSFGDLLGSGDRPLLEEYRVQIRLISSLSTLPFPEKQFRVQALHAVVGMDVKGPVSAQTTKVSPSLATWLLVPPCYQLNLGSCLCSYSLSDNSWSGEELCFPSCSFLQRGQGDFEGRALHPTWSLLRRKGTLCCLVLLGSPQI